MTVMSTVAGATRPTATLVAAGDLLRALAAPVRIAIVLELLVGSRCNCRRALFSKCSKGSFLQGPLVLLDNSSNCLRSK
jgi:hypothetical protein